MTILSIYLDLLVRAVDHGNEHVEKNHHHCHIIDSIQHVADVLYELMVVLQYNRDHFRQSEDRPEKSLKTLLDPARNDRENVVEKNLYSLLKTNIHITAKCVSGLIVYKWARAHTHNTHIASLLWGFMVWH